MELKITKGDKEDGIVIGNAFDKYGSKNPIVKFMMAGFDRSLQLFVQQVNPKSIHEVGCGEGYWVIKWSQQGIPSKGSDFSNQVISLAKENALRNNVPEQHFAVKSVYELNPKTDAADLVVCCEVLEHLEDPEKALARLASVATRNIIISVPREPVWRMLNMMRFKYLRNLGNTPGHIQHWSSSEIVRLVSRYFTVIAVRRPFPWTMLLCKEKDSTK